MKKYILFFLMLLSVQMVAAQGMSDQQVLQFIQKETKAGTSQSQIVTKLMQRGVKVDQIQRLRKQYADKMLQDENQRRSLIDRALDTKLSAALKNVVKLEHKQVSLDEFNKLFEKA